MRCNEYIVCYDSREHSTNPTERSTSTSTVIVILCANPPRDLSIDAFQPGFQKFKTSSIVNLVNVLLLVLQTYLSSICFISRVYQLSSVKIFEYSRSLFLEILQSE